MAGIHFDERAPWTTSGTFLLFFIIINVLLSLTNHKRNNYWTHSMLSFAGLTVVAFLLASLFSKLSMNEAGSYRWIFTVISVGYLVLMVIIGLMRRIVEYAMREDWNQPRPHQSKKKHR